MVLSGFVGHPYVVSMLPFDPFNYTYPINTVQVSRQSPNIPDAGFPLKSADLEMEKIVLSGFVGHAYAVLMVPFDPSFYT